MSLADYDAESRSAHCWVCGTGLRYVNGKLTGCPWEGCPAYGTVPDDDMPDPGPPGVIRKLSRIEALRITGSMEALHGATDDEIEAYERELAGAGTRAMSADAAYAALEMRALLDLQEVAGELLSIEIEHGSEP